MDSAKQAEGEKRVRQHLIDPLLNRGLAKPASITKDVFEKMLATVCQKLAYMTEGGLQALEEEAAGRVAIAGRDRFPIGNDLCEWAATIEKPSDSASPLTRKVFASDIGRAAIEGGFGPELLDQVKTFRRWPTGFVVNVCREKAEDHIRFMRRTDADIEADRPLSPPDQKRRDKRLAKLRWCEEIRAMGEVAGGEA